MHLSFSFANLAMLQSCWDDSGGGQKRGLVPRAGGAWGKPASSLQALQSWAGGSCVIHGPNKVPAVGQGEQGGS